MTNSKWLLVVLFATYLLHELWTLWPKSETEYAAFPLKPDILITRQTYIHMLCKYAIWVIMMAIIYAMYPEARDVMIWFVAFQFLELIEYILTYNKAIYRLSILGLNIGINITNIKAVVMFILVTKKVLTWNHGR